jgi:hypothetical protein
MQYGQLMPLEEKEEKSGLNFNLIKPREYLEKIFQIPFHLKNPNDEDVKGLVDFLLKDQIATEDNDELERDNSKLNRNESIIEQMKDADLVYDESENSKSSHLEYGLFFETEETDDENEIITANPKNLKLGPDELVLIKEMVWLVGPVTRTIKRFINIYRIIRAHQGLEYRQDNSHTDHLSVLFLLAVNIGEQREHMVQLRKELKAQDDARLSSILEKIEPLEPIIKRFETNSHTKQILDFSAQEVSRHLDFVSRFSFRKLS